MITHCANRPTGKPESTPTKTEKSRIENIRNAKRAKMSFFYSDAPVDDDILYGWEFDSYDGRYYWIHPKRHCAPFPRPVPSYQQSDHVRPLYVKFLDGHIDEYLLECMFSPFGTVTGSRICRNWYGRSKGFGFVWFANDQEAADAGYWMDGRPIEGTELYVAPAEHWENRQARLAAESGREDDDWFDEDDDYYEDEDWYDDDEFFEEDNPVYCDDRNCNGNNQWNQRAPSAPNEAPAPNVKQEQWLRTEGGGDVLEF